MRYNHEIYIPKYTKISVLRKKILVAASLLTAVLIPNIMGWGISCNGILDQILIPISQAAPIGGSTSPIGSGVQKVIAIILEMVVVVNWFSLSMIQWLLSPEALFDGNFSSGSSTGAIEMILRNIWITSRNIVNGIFAFMLLIAGIYMILKAGEEGMTTIKNKLPKFVLAVIFVNFSWFFPRVILDVSNVMTATIYQIPNLVNGYDRGNMTCYSDLGADNARGGVNENADEYCKYVWNVEFFPCDDLPSGQQCLGPQPTGTPPNMGRSFGKLLHIYYDDWNAVARNGTVSGRSRQASGADTIINGLAANFARLPAYGVMEAQELSIGATSRVGAAAEVRAHFKALLFIVMQLVFALAVALPLLAMVFVLIARVIVLWLCIGFMPFIFLGYAMGGQLGQLSLGGEEGPNIWKKFVTYAFLPALIAVPFAIGFTLISALYYHQSLFIATSPPMGMEGLLKAIPGIDSFHEMLWLMMTIGIVWFGTFTMLEKDSLASSFTGAIKGVGQAGFKTAVNAVGYAPIMPMPGGGKGGIANYANMLKRSGSGNPYLALGKGSGGGSGAVNKERIDKTTELSKNITNDGQLNQLRDILKDTNNGNASKQLDTFAKKLSDISNSVGRPIDTNEAREIATNSTLMKTFVGSLPKLSSGEKSDMISKAEHFQSVSSSTDPRSVMNFKVDASKNKDDTVKEVAKEAAGFINTTSLNADQVLKALKEDKEKGATNDIKNGMQEVIDKIEDIQKAGGGDDKIVEELKKLYPSP